MNYFLAWQLYSFRRELTFVAAAFLLVILMPIVGILVITQTGINIVSEALVNLDEISLTVQLKNPLDGTIYKELSGPFIWPSQGVFTLEFGESSIYQPFHTGLDIAGKKGDPVYAFMPGTVTYAREIFWGYGKHVIIDHGDNISTVYAHLNTIEVTKGQEILQGQLIGTQGSTGWSTGTHLHFEVRLFGIPVNPRVFLGKHF